MSAPLEEMQARAMKAGRLVDALTGCGAITVEAETVARMDDAGWEALEALAGTRPASAATRALVVERLALRASLAASDPFEGLPVSAADAFRRMLEEELPPERTRLDIYLDSIRLGCRGCDEPAGPPVRDGLCADCVAEAGLCSLCGRLGHTERQVCEDGEWDEDCRFIAYFDGDGRDLRRRSAR